MGKGGGGGGGMSSVLSMGIMFWSWEFCCSEVWFLIEFLLLINGTFLMILDYELVLFSKKGTLRTPFYETQLEAPREYISAEVGIFRKNDVFGSWVNECCFWLSNIYDSLLCLMLLSCIAWSLSCPVLGWFCNSVNNNTQISFSPQLVSHEYIMHWTGRETPAGNTIERALNFNKLFQISHQPGRGMSCIPCIGNLYSNRVYLCSYICYICAQTAHSDPTLLLTQFQPNSNLVEWGITRGI